MPGVAVVIQARTGSTRLPGKVLLDLAGRPMLALQVARVRSATYDRLIVATSDLERDDPIADLCARLDVEVIRGSETDVLARFAVVLDRCDPANIVRLTADCPLTDPGIVDDVIDLHERSGADYTSNVHPRSFPHGLDVEVMTANALETAHRAASDAYDREHVTPYLYREPGRFETANLESGRDLAHLRWTIDTTEDIEHVRRIVGELSDPERETWRQILDRARRSGLAS